MSRCVTLILPIPASLAVGAVLPGLVAKLRSSAAPGNAGAEKSEPSGGAGGGLIRLSAEQIEAAKIEARKVGPGMLKRQITVPAAVTPDPDRVARVAAKVSGVVAELRKRLGDQVANNETIAIIDSREVADAKNGYLAARANYEIQSQLFQRENGLLRRR